MRPTDFDFIESIMFYLKRSFQIGLVYVYLSELKMSLNKFEEI